MELALDLPVLRAPWRLRPVVPARTDDLGIADVVSEIGLGDSRPARLTVTRTADGDLHDRQVYLYLDGEDWATIYFGQTITREIAPAATSSRRTTRWSASRWSSTHAPASTCASAASTGRTGR